jgi:hypothetical protein
MSLEEINYNSVTCVLRDDKLHFTFDGQTLKEFTELHPTGLLTDKDLMHLAHDLVCQKLRPGVEQDSSLKTICKRSTPADYLTPDFIDMSSDTVRLLEVKTTVDDKRHDFRKLEIDETYKDEFFERCKIAGRKGVFQHCIVSPNKVSTNLIMSKITKAYLSMLVRVATKLKLRARSSGWSYDDDGELCEDEKQMFSNMKLLSVPEQAETPVISKALLKHWSEISEREAEQEAGRQITSAIKKSVGKINEAIKRFKDKTPDEIDREYDLESTHKANEYWKAHDSHHNTNRNDSKAVVQAPLLVAKTRENFDPHQSLHEICSLNITSDRAHSRLWISCLNWASRNTDSVYPEAIDHDTDGFVKKKRRAKHFRVKSKVSLEDEAKLATVGIESKRYKGDAVVQSLIDEKSKGFVSSCWTDDITNFISDFKFTERVNPFIEDPLDLYDRALELTCDPSVYNKFTSESRSFYESFANTNLGVALDTLDYIVQEVNISRQQYCNSGEFILKVLPRIKIALLIKPTKPDGQIFYSVLVKKEDILEKFDLPFKTLYSFGDAYISEFVSLNQHSITHYLYIREKMTVLMSMWLSLHENYLSSFSTFKMKQECKEHFLASLLFWLEGKEQTSKEVQQIRYAYMECAMDNKINYDPLKILNKWEHFSRSRLCVWMRKKVIGCLINMKPTKNYICTDEFDLADFNKSMDKDCRILSWVSGQEVGKFEIALNLSYFGVLHNKEDSKEMHGFLKIFSKVVSEELAMRRAKKENMGYTSKDPDQLITHEFNAKYVCHIGDKIRNILDQKHGNCKDWIKDKCSKRLLTRDILKMATMKKSATGDLTRVEHIKESKENERITCLEACIKHMREGYDSLPMKQIGTLAKQIQSEYGGIVSNLFKKLQIGGVREIFVLEFRCRIVIHFVESICRRVGEELDNEMLTKGKGKLSRSDKHFSEVLTHLRPSRHSTTVINSDDATTWAQRFVMPVFGCFLSRILPDEFIEPVMFVLNLVTNKKLELPHQLLDLYEKHPDVYGFDEGMNEMKRQYMNLSENRDLLSHKGRMLNNRSNMMQGILHFTSSLLHSGFMYVWEDYTKRYISAVLMNRYRLRKREFEVVVTTKVSSDDSSCIVTAIFEKESKDKDGSIPALPKNVQYLLSICTETKELLYPLMCCKQSREKSSTSCHSSIEEFNSIWYCKNTLLTPMIKFTASSIRTHPASKMDDRFSTFSNLRKNLFEHGGNIMVCQVSQICQLSAHYKTLGLMTNTKFDDYKTMLFESPHPSLGFFIVEHPLCVGMFGNDFATYLACNDRRFRNLHLGLYENEMFEHTKEGKPTVRTYISFGQSKKYFAFKKKLDIKESLIKQHFDDNVINLYRDVRGTEDALMELQLRAADPSLSESMAFQTDSRLHAASAYILQDKVVMSSKGMMNPVHEHSTFFELAKSMKSSSLDEYKWLFPYSNFYDNVLSLLKVYQSSSLSTYQNKRSVANKLDILTNNLLQTVTLFQACQRKWFSLPEVRGTVHSHNVVWEHYSSKFEWLSDTVEETLEKSPFNTHVSLRNYLLSVSSKKKTVLTYAPSNIVSSTMEIVKSMIENCQWKGQKLNYIRTDSVEDTDHSMRILTERVWRCLRAPRVPDKVKFVESILETSTDMFASTDMTNSIYNLTKNQMALAILIKFVKLKKDKGNLLQIIPGLIQRYSMGIIGRFTVVQSFVNGAYVGEGEYSGSMEGCKIIIKIRDQSVKEIVVESEDHLRKMSDTIKTFCREIGLTMVYDITPNKQMWNFKVKRMTKLKNLDSCYVRFKDMKNSPEMSYKSMELQISSFDKIRLINKECGRQYTILSFRVRPSDLGRLDEHSDVNNCSDELTAHWLASTPVVTKYLEDEILRDPNLESWASNTLRRRLQGRNRLPNLDSIYNDPVENVESEVNKELNDIEIKATMSSIAMQCFTQEDAEFFAELMPFDSDTSSQCSSEDSKTELLVPLMFQEMEQEDLSWLLAYKEPTEPRLIFDSAISNKFFDSFIKDYFEVFGPSFYMHMVKCPSTLSDLIYEKRKRSESNQNLFGLKVKFKNLV